MSRKKAQEPAPVVVEDHSQIPDSSKVWTAFSVIAALLAATLTRRGLNSFWKAATGKEPPVNPADPDVSMREALAWAAISGTLIAVVRMLAARRAAGYYTRSTGHLPPGLGPDAERDTAKA